MGSEDTASRPPQARAAGVRLRLSLAWSLIDTVPPSMTSTLDLPAPWLDEFDRRPFRFDHALADHAALKLDSLSEIILSLPRDQVFASRADLKIDTDFDRAHVDHAIDRTLEATLKDMATTNAYVMVRQPDSHPRLKPVLDLFQTELREHIRSSTKGAPPGVRAAIGEHFHDPMLYLFISSPNSVTPFHVDRYSTLLLQLQGEKEVMIWDRYDRKTVTEEELESLFGRPYLNNPSYKGAHTREPLVNHLVRGQGVHIPFTAPHWVKNGSAVSVSISFICQTGAARRQANAYHFNFHARRLLSRLPVPLTEPPLGSVGTSSLVDRAKSGLIRSVYGLKRRLLPSRASQ
jgi:hypothetical protein